ncbi:hypothetical protein AVEN_223358-1 [Araneus ventricosus]|uniref:Uncharacterized protein n=1 Tax=Araneus ventricosus TaxID=182803 RepID=A0A4Y2SUG0_ARAVE|nr:hypothetical protein AVEN_223358-1 [Araneus ventricosus]
MATLGRGKMTHFVKYTRKFRGDHSRWFVNAMNNPTSERNCITRLLAYTDDCSNCVIMAKMQILFDSSLAYVVVSYSTCSSPQLDQVQESARPQKIYR